MPLGCYITKNKGTVEMLKIPLRSGLWHLFTRRMLSLANSFTGRTTESTASITSSTNPLPTSVNTKQNQYNAMRARCMNAGSGELATNGVDAATRTSRWVNEVKRKGVVVIRYAWRILIRYKPMPHQSCQETWISQEIRDISSLRAHEPRAVTMKLWEPKRKCPKAVPTHLQNRAVW